MIQVSLYPRINPRRLQFFSGFSKLLVGQASPLDSTGAYSSWPLDFQLPIGRAQKKWQLDTRGHIDHEPVDTQRNPNLRRKAKCNFARS